MLAGWLWVSVARSEESAEMWDKTAALAEAPPMHDAKKQTIAACARYMTTAPNRADHGAAHKPSNTAQAGTRSFIDCASRHRLRSPQGLELVLYSIAMCAP